MKLVTHAPSSESQSRDSGSAVAVTGHDFAVSRSELRLLRRVAAGEAAARTGIAGDALEMAGIADRDGALDGDRIELGTFRSTDDLVALDVAAPVAVGAGNRVPLMAPTLA